MRKLIIPACIVLLALPVVAQPIKLMSEEEVKSRVNEAMQRLANEEAKDKEYLRRKSDNAVLDIVFDELRLKTDALNTQLTARRPERLSDNLTHISDAYLRAAGQRQTAQYVIEKALDKFHIQAEACKSAAQMSAVCDEAAVRLQILQVAQNQKIIELLEELNKQPKYLQP